MKYFSLTALLFFCVASMEATPTPLTPAQALNKLMEGNTHFAKGANNHTNYVQEAKNKQLEQQHPFAVVIGCSDSRVPPELIFDQGLGDLFVIRDVANVIGPVEMDSVEFAVAKLAVPLIVVLGHQNCSGVTAAINGQGQSPELDQIIPMIDKGLNRCSLKNSDKLLQSIYCNVKNSMNILKSSPTIAPLIEQKKVEIVGLYFDFDSGKVIQVP